MSFTPRMDSVAGDPVLTLAEGRALEYELGCAILSWDEESNRALREASRVVRANRLLDEAFSHVRNIPLADAIAAHLAESNP